MLCSSRDSIASSTVVAILDIFHLYRFGNNTEASEQVIMWASSLFKSSYILADG